MTREDALYALEMIKKEALRRSKKKSTPGAAMDLRIVASYEATVKGLAKGYVFPKLALSIEGFADRVFS